MELRRLEPERTEQIADAAPAGYCCCCCCCCLHTIGGIVGAVRATEAPKVVSNDLAVPPARVGGKALEPLHSAGKTYWLAFWFIAVAYFIGCAIEVRADEAVIVYFWSVVLGLPVGLLGASLLAFFPLYYSSRPGRRNRLGHLARITGHVFVGTFIGLIPSAAIFWLIIAS